MRGDKPMIYPLRWCSYEQTLFFLPAEMTFLYSGFTHRVTRDLHTRNSHDLMVFLRPCTLFFVLAEISFLYSVITQRPNSKHPTLCDKWFQDYSSHFMVFMRPYSFLRVGINVISLFNLFTQVKCEKLMISPILWSSCDHPTMPLLMPYLLFMLFILFMPITVCNYTIARINDI